MISWMRVWCAMAVLAVVTGTAGAQSVAGWKAVWVGAKWSTVRDGAEVDGSRPLPIFRKDVLVRKPLRRAEFRIAGLGQWQAELAEGGVRTAIGGSGLHQAWTDYRKTVTYESYDLTSKLRRGRAVLTISLGNGMYNVQHSVMANGKARYTKLENSFGAPKVIAELRLTYTDGTTETVGTDDGWQCARGPVGFSSIYGGEDYDARVQASGWSPVVEVPGPGGELMAAISPEVGESAVHAPVKQSEAAGRVVYDLGVNFAGVPRIAVDGPAGATLKLTPGELLKPDGSVSQASSGGPMWWSYTLRGGGRERWQPRFSYYGFRYLQAEWVGAAAGTIEKIAGVGWHSRAEAVGKFSSSSDALNRIHALIVNAMHNNEASVFTDCPHREKLGWLEETHLVGAAMMFNNELSGLYRATSRNIADAQGEDGGVPTIAPQYTKFGPKYAIFDDSPEWGSAAILAPWAAYRFYGDVGELRRNYAVMKRYLGFLAGRAKDGIVAYGLGDWYDIGPGGPGVEKNTSLGVTATLMLYEDAAAMQQVAALIGKDDDARAFGALAGRTAKAFGTRFWNEERGWYDTGSQTANAMPLALGMVPEARRARVLAHVIDDLHGHQDHVTTGEVGYPYLLRALMAAGRDDVVLAMLLRTDPPSYGAQLAAGATALTEAWDANPHSSQDHLMLGAGEEWFYRGLGGIDLDEARADKLVLRPRAVTGVDWVRCGYEWHAGHVESDWRRTGAAVDYTFTLPAGSGATVELAGARSLDGDVAKSPGVFHIGAGVHRFRVE